MINEEIHLKSEKSIVVIGMLLFSILFIGVTYKFKNYSFVAAIFFYVFLAGLMATVFYIFRIKSYIFYSTFFTVNRKKIIPYTSIESIRTSLHPIDAGGIPLLAGRIQTQNESIYIVLKNGEKFSITEFDYDNFRLMRKFLSELEPNSKRY